MAWPEDEILSLHVETYLDENVASADPAMTSGWYPMTPRWSDGIDVRFGRTSETSSSATSNTCSFTLSNADGEWTADNPASSVYDRFTVGSPVRFSIVRVVDTFSRSITGSWGTGDNDQVWTDSGVSSTANDWYVNNGIGYHSVDAAGENRISSQLGIDYYDVDISFSIDFQNITNVTGTGQGLSVTVGQNSAALARVSVYPSEDVNISVQPSLTSHAVTAFSGWAGEQLRVRVAYVDGSVSVKVWRPSVEVEPADWQITQDYRTDPDVDIPTAGPLTFISTVSSGNTNVKPVVFEYSDIQVLIPRFIGKVTQLRQVAGAHPSDTKLYVEASGVLQRLGRQRKVNESAIRRAITNNEIQPVAYWPLEDENGARQMGSGLAGGQPMVYVGGDTDSIELSTNEDFAGSLPLPEFTGPLGAFFKGKVIDPEPSGVVTALLVCGLISIPAGGVAQAVQVLTFRTDAISSTIGEMMIEAQTSGEVRFRARDGAGIDQEVSSISTGFTLNGRPSLLYVYLESSGGINYEVGRYDVETGEHDFFQDTIASSFGNINEVSVGLGGDLGGASLGHVAAYQPDAGSVTLADLASAAYGYVGETAGERLERLMTEEGQEFRYIGDIAETTPMGAQPAAPVIDIINECVNADLGMLYEPRNSTGLVYRTRTSIYRQSDPIEFDYSGGDLASPLEAVNDDATRVNSVTLQRPGGGTYVAELLTGVNSIDEIGVYSEGLSVNVEDDGQLEDHAWWRVALGTTGRIRVPTLRLRVERLPDRLEELSSIVPGSLIRLNNLPAWLYPESGSSRDYVVIGYSENVDQFSWSINLACVAGELYNVPVIGTSEYKVDSADSFVDADALSGATSLSIRSTWLWTTSAGQMPISIKIGGEEMSVTAISGASSPQTFTVTRSVNGVVKPVYENEEVHLSPRPRFGY